MTPSPDRTRGQKRRCTSGSSVQHVPSSSLLFPSEETGRYSGYICRYVQINTGVPGSWGVCVTGMPGIFVCDVSDNEAAPNNELAKPASSSGT